MYTHILIPVAFDGAHPTKPAEEVARRLADPGAQVTFLHVMDEVPNYALSYIPADYDAQSQKALEEELAAKVRDFGSGQGVVIRGHAGRDIVSWAKAHDVDLIVMASHRPDLSDYFLGSTAARVVRHAPCNVHVLR